MPGGGRCDAEAPGSVAVVMPHAACAGALVRRIWSERVTFL